MKKLIMKIFKIISFLILFGVIVILIGRMWNNRTPKNGINESMYVEVNGTKQWISIYGEDLDNPVLLYLHGGPGAPTSDKDYVFTRKWADVYTVVTWDQRASGKSSYESQGSIKLSKELFLQDGKEITEFIRKYLSKEKISILGHSWGSIFGANLVLEYPDYYDAFIGAGQLIDITENEKAFKEKAIQWSERDPEGKKLVAQLNDSDMDFEYVALKNKIMKRYGYDLMKDGTDYNLITAQVFNPYYSLKDWIEFTSRDFEAYKEFITSQEFKDFSLKGRFDYKVSYYNINGNMDYQTNFELAQKYFDKVNSPKKKIYIMKDTAHGLLESKSEEFSKLVHDIASEEAKKKR